MKRITFVFSTVSHGTATDQEDSDVLLAASTLTDDLATFFIADDVFQLLSGQRSGTVLARDYIVTLKLLGLCGIEQYRVCTASLRRRGLGPRIPFVVGVTPLEADALCHELVNYDVTLRF